MKWWGRAVAELDPLLPELPRPLTFRQHSNLFALESTLSHIGRALRYARERCWTSAGREYGFSVWSVSDVYACEVGSACVERAEALVKATGRAVFEAEHAQREEDARRLAALRARIEELEQPRTQRSVRAPRSKSAEARS